MFPLIWFFLLLSVSDASKSTHQDKVQQNSRKDTNVASATRLSVDLKCSSEVSKQKPEMILNLTEGKHTSMNCTNFCFGSKPQLTWIWRRTGYNEREITKDMKEFSFKNITIDTRTNTSTLTFKVSAQHHNTNITCKATGGNTSTEETIYLKVMSSPKILNSSGCVDHSEFLICKCISEGFPSPNISWPLLKNSTKYFLMNCTSDHSVKSIMIVSRNGTKDRNVECVSENNVGKANTILNISNEPQQSKHSVCSEQTSFFTPQQNVHISKGSQNPRPSFFASILEKVLEDLTQFLIVFGTGVLIGMSLLSIIACFVVRCHRLLHKNRKKSRNLYEGLEMVNTETFPKIQEIQEDRIQDPEAAEGGAESDEQLAAESNESTKETVHSDIYDTDMAPKETVYSNIDFSAMKERNPTDVDTTETEYAEIKRGESKERQDNDGEEGEMLEGSDVKEGIKEEDEEVKQGLLAEEVVGGDVPLYSTVDEILDEN